MYSPLEQFSIFHTFTLLHCFYDLNIMEVTIALCVSIIFYWFHISTYRIMLVSSDAYQFITVAVYNFVLSLVKQQAGRNAIILFPFIFWTFIFIAVANLVSLIPFCFTVNAHISVTLYLALSLNLAFLIYGFLLNGLEFLNLFVPKGVPSVLVPVIVVIELISYSIRSFSLALRLFANLMAGHTLIHILVGFIVAAATIDLFLVIVMYPVILAVGLLELFIAVLQAYVFAVLLSIYFADALVPGH